jgi:hypothetical protein
MNLKDIKVGEEYELVSKKKSRPGCADVYFDKFKKQPITVIKKLQNFKNKNILYIQGILHDEDIGPVELINFWCSPYDLKEII